MSKFYIYITNALRHAVSCSSHVISVNITASVWNSINKKQNGL